MNSIIYEKTSYVQTPEAYPPILITKYTKDAMKKTTIKNIFILIKAETRLIQYKLTGYYGGTMRLPLGADSLETLNFLNRFGVSFEWDPNRGEGDED
ncbi:MAG: hypothetical protein JW969_14880 [Spirochaetales bacterium]|nr:hypothetical protein [Spirochaetales bacterium]